MKLTVNNITYDEFGRPSGVVAINKPAGVTSHDLVDVLRKKYNTRKVGHVGALDVFATGVMIYLIGKSTKLSEKLMHLDKEYKTTILFGVATDTQDPEGKVTEIKTGYSISEITDLDNVIESFEGKYSQYVSVYSSVKVDGKKLRKLMRTDGYDKQIRYSEKHEKQLVLTPKKDSNLEEIVVNIPQRIVTIFEIEKLEEGQLPVSELSSIPDLQTLPTSQVFPFIVIRVKTSKGTYIRQLSEDIGAKLGMPAMLLTLTRTRVGEIKLEDCIEADSL